MEATPFLDRARPPRPAELSRALGTSSALWKELERGLAADLGPLQRAWTYSGKAHGWSLRLAKGKRAVVYLLPRGGGFLAAFALGEKACAAARESSLSSAVLAAIEDAPRYAEGRGVRLLVRGKKDAAQVRALAAIKLAH
jgi:hypothetical protein